MDIVPIQLSLTAGDLITLWAPNWRENGEEWEGFLGDDEGVHAFPDAVQLAAYVRTTEEHDLVDHPAWPMVLQLPAPDLVPTSDQCYDLVGVPEIAANSPDTWTVGELASIATVVRSLAEACELDAVHEVLDSTEAFAVLDKGAWAFSGRDGTRLWAQLAEVIADRWDEVIDALDAMVRVPEVDPDAVAVARQEFDDTPAHPEDSESAVPGAASTGTVAKTSNGKASSTAGTASAGRVFWEEVGIDPVLISADDGDYYTLRCYLDDQPVFLGSAGRIHALPSGRALARYLTTEEGTGGHDLTRAATWPTVLAKAAADELTVEIDPQNVYQLSGLSEDLAAGPAEVDAHQLDLAVELLLDVGAWAGDDAAKIALSRSQSLGWLTSFVLDPDINRLAPSPPFDTEVKQWDDLVAGTVARLRRR